MFFQIIKGNPNHDKLGRFSTGGDGRTPASDLAKEKNIQLLSPEAMIKKALGGNTDLIQEFHNASAKVARAVENGEETFRQHALNLPDLLSGKSIRVKYSESRLKSHRAIIDSILEGSSKYLPKDGSSPEVLFLGGRGGSGKGNFDSSRSPESGVYSTETHLLLDPDVVKKKMKEYDPEMAYLVHRESADIFDKLVTEVRHRGLNAVLDTTMRSPVKSVVRAFEKSGYDMHAHFMHMSPEGSALRAVQRWSSGETLPSGVKSQRGRLVPPEVIYSMKNNEKNFDAILPKMKSWSVWSNDKPLGVPPTLVASSKDKAKKGLAGILVEKANPYHDARGRFTSRANSTFVSVWGKAYANIDAADKHSANAKASSHQKQKVKEFAHILGLHVRSGGTTEDAFGKAALSQAQLHAEGAKAYGTHSVPNIGLESRGKINEAVAQAFAASNLTTSQKVKAGIPLTEAEKAAIEKSKAYDKAHYSKKQVAKVHADIEAMSEKLHSLAKLPDYHTNPEYVKLSKKITKAVSLGKKHGATPDELGESINKGKNKAINNNEDAKKELHAALVKMHKAAAAGINVGAHAVAVDNLLAKHQGVLSKEEIDAVGAYAVHDFDQQKSVAQDKLANAYSEYQPFKADQSKGVTWVSQAKLHGVTKEHISGLYKEYQAAFSHVSNNFGEMAAYEAVQKGKEIHAAKKAAGVTPIHSAVQLTAAQPKPSLSDVLLPDNQKQANAPAKTTDAPKVANPSSLKEPKTKEEALDVAKAMGTQFYLLKEGKYSNHKESPPKELNDAYALYDQAKNSYVKLGGSKDEFYKISGQLKESAIAAIQAEADKAKVASTNAYNALAKASHDFEQAKTEFGVSSPKAKEAENALKEAKKSAAGVVKEDMIEPAIAEGVQTHKANYAVKKAAALQDVHEASYGLNLALIKHKGNQSHEDVLKAASHYDSVVSQHSASNMFSAAELATTTAQAKSKAKANAKAMAEYTKQYGSALKVADTYDKEADSFKYLHEDKAFEDHGKKQIAKLTDTEQFVISSYTGSAFRAINKAVGEAGTNKMKGLPVEHLSSVARDRMEAMDSAFAKTTLGKNVKLRRNMPQKFFWEQFGISLDKVSSLKADDLGSMVGRVYKETAFSSTSMDPYFSSSFSNAAKSTGGLTLHIRAGAKMPGLRAKAISNHQGEGEVILPRGTTYVIRKIVPSDNGVGKFEVHVDMIGAFPDKL